MARKQNAKRLTPTQKLQVRVDSLNNQLQAVKLNREALADIIWELIGKHIEEKIEEAVNSELDSLDVSVSRY